MSVKFDTTDFDFQIDFNQEENRAFVNHLYVYEELRQNGYGSVILETLKRVSLHKEGIEEIVVSIGGGEVAEEFLKENGFKIINRREYSEEMKKREGSCYGVDAVYKETYISDDY